MYHVVFEYTEKAGAHAGLRYRVRFDSKKDFDVIEAKLPLESKKVRRVLEEGISNERSLELCEAVPVRNRVAAAFENARVGEHGEIDPVFLEMELAQVRYALRLSAVNREQK